MRSGNSSFCYVAAALLIVGNLLCLQGMLPAQETHTMSKVLAPTPPMGWNTWDSYGLRINKQQFRENLDTLATKLKAFGHTYAVMAGIWSTLRTDPSLTLWFAKTTSGCKLLAINHIAIPKESGIQVLGHHCDNVTLWAESSGPPSGVAQMAIA